MESFRITSSHLYPPPQKKTWLFRLQICKNKTENRLKKARTLQKLGKTNKYLPSVHAHTRSPPIFLSPDKESSGHFERFSVASGTHLDGSYFGRISAKTGQNSETWLIFFNSGPRNPGRCWRPSIEVRYVICIDFVSPFHFYCLWIVVLLIAARFFGFS